MVVLDLILWSIVEKFACFSLITPSGKNIQRIGDAYMDNAVFLATQNSPDLSKEKNIITISTFIEAIFQDFERKLYPTGG